LVISCIYRILNKKTGKFYVGRTKNFGNRKKDHLCRLRWGKHSNNYLQNSWDKHGEENFVFEIVEECGGFDELMKREQFWLDKTRCYDHSIGYNISKDATGVLLSEETKRKISKAHKGKKLIEEHKRRVSEGNKGKKLSEECKRKISVANKGRKRTAEQRKRISDACMGRKLSEAQKAKISFMFQGEKSQNSKLTNEQVKSIRVDFEEVKVGKRREFIRAMAEKYEVCACTIKNAAYKQTFKYVGTK